MSMSYEDMPDAMTVPEFARAVDWNENSVRRAIRRHGIPAKKVGGRWVIFKAAVFGETEGAVGHGDAEPCAASR